MKIETILRVPVVVVFVFLAGSAQRAEAQSLRNAVTAERMTPEVKSANRHQQRRRHLRHRERTHHLDPGW